MPEINAIALAKGVLLLTLGYFCLWLFGPLFMEKAGSVWGLPLWFWVSCIFAPVCLMLVLPLWLYKGARRD